MRDLEYVAERVAHHSSPVPVGGVERRLQADGSGRQSSAVDVVGVVDVNVEESWEQLTVTGRAHHDKRVTDAHLSWPTSMQLTDSAEDGAQELNRSHSVADDHARSDGMESRRTVDAHAANI